MALHPHLSPWDPQGESQEHGYGEKIAVPPAQLSFPLFSFPSFPSHMEWVEIGARDFRTSLVTMMPVSMVV